MEFTRSSVRSSVNDMRSWEIPMQPGQTTGTFELPRPQNTREDEMVSELEDPERGRIRRMSALPRTQAQAPAVAATAAPSTTSLLHQAYQVFDLSPNCTMERLKEKWKQLSLRYHPDKGGDPAAFQRIHRLFRKIYRDTMLRTKGDIRQVQDFPNQPVRYEDHLPQEALQMRKGNEDLERFANKGFNAKLFNTLFDNTRVTQAHDRGYEDQMAGRQTSLDVPTIDVEQTAKTPKEMHRLIRERNQKRLADKKAVIVVEQPQPLPPLTNYGYQELGVENVDDYGSSARTLGSTGSTGDYSDYLKAHEGWEQIVDEDLFPKRKEYSSVDKLRSERESAAQSYDVTRSVSDYADFQSRESKRNYQRSRQQQYIDDLQAEAYSKVNQKLLAQLPHDR